MECLYLTPDELSGYTLFSGPWDTPDECAVNCGSSSSLSSGGVTTGCCPNLLPSILYVTATMDDGGSGDCCAATVGPFPIYLTRVETDFWEWTGEVAGPCLGTIKVTLQCSNAADAWTLQVGCNDDPGGGVGPGSGYDLFHMICGPPPYWYGKFLATSGAQQPCWSRNYPSSSCDLTLEITA